MNLNHWKDRGLKIIWKDKIVSRNENEQYAPLRGMGYPYLAFDAEEYLVILFTAKKTGIVLCSTKPEAGRVGEWSSDWIEEAFYPLQGEVKMYQWSKELEEWSKKP